MLVFALFSSTTPYLGPIGVTGFGLVGFIYFVAFLSLYVFVDKGILVAIDLDFFHRDALRWMRVRKPFTVIVVACLAFGTFFFNSFSNPAAWIVAIDDVAILVGFSIIGFAGVTLIVASRRTADRTMKRHIRWLGAGLAMLVLSLPFPSGSDPLPDIIYDALIVAFVFSFYRAAMSLSPLGRVEKEAARTSTMVSQGRAPT